MPNFLAVNVSPKWFMAVALALIVGCTVTPAETDQSVSDQSLDGPVDSEATLSAAVESTVAARTDAALATESAGAAIDATVAAIVQETTTAQNTAQAPTATEVPARAPTATFVPTATPASAASGGSQADTQAGASMLSPGGRPRRASGRAGYVKDVYGHVQD